MRAEFYGCALQRTGKSARQTSGGKPVYYFSKYRVLRGNNAPRCAGGIRTGRGRRNFDSAGRYDDWRPVARRRRGPTTSLQTSVAAAKPRQHEVRECLSQGEGEGERDTLCTRTLPTGRRARRRGTDDASALGCEGYPATTHYFTKKKRRSGGNNMTDGTPSGGRGAAAMMSPVPQLQVYLTSHCCRSAMVSLPSSPPLDPRPTAPASNPAARGSAPG